MKIRIGIITHYYKSLNYGGNLQAYALCKLLNDKQIVAEQLCYERKHEPQADRVKRMKGIKIRKVFCVLSNKIKKKRLPVQMNSRMHAILEFNQGKIPHSTEVYDGKTISDANKDYDVFITGSDQVWHPKAICSAYRLDFADSAKAKFSYAASIASDVLNEEQKDLFRKSFIDYMGVSVREESAVELLGELSPVEVEWSLDPTLLLTCEEWDQICPESLIQEKYLFCFFLGDDENMRNIAVEFAKKHHLKLVTLPYLLWQYRKCDLKFGDEQLYDVSPEQFISLIKHAEYVFTDSFHASVFSAIYQREYFIFKRIGGSSMESRIYSFVKLFESEDHFCDTTEKATIDYIGQLEPLDYSGAFPLFEEMKEKSLAYLEKNLLKAKERLELNEN